MEDGRWRMEHAKRLGARHPSAAFPLDRLVRPARKRRRAGAVQNLAARCCSFLLLLSAFSFRARGKATRLTGIKSPAAAAPAPAALSVSGTIGQPDAGGADDRRQLFAHWRFLGALRRANAGRAVADHHATPATKPSSHGRPPSRVGRCKPTSIWPRRLGQLFGAIVNNTRDQCAAEGQSVLPVEEIITAPEAGHLTPDALRQRFSATAAGPAAVRGAADSGTGTG